MDEKHLRAIDTSALWHPFTQMAAYAREDPAPPIIVGAEGNWLIAHDGKRYLDANCGYWCLALGCRPAAVENAIKAQLDRFSHSTLLGLSHLPALQLAEKLTALAGPPLNHVFFADSGSEAVEVALKMAYQCQVQRGHSERSEFLALGEAYHGDTLGAVAVGGVDLFHATFRPLLFPVRRVPPPHCYRCPWSKNGPDGCALDCAAAMEAAIAENHARLAAVVLEPFVLGPGGVIPHPESYLERVVTAARKHGVLVIFDEVAVGMGRLGTLFAFQQMELPNPEALPCEGRGERPQRPGAQDSHSPLLVGEGPGERLVPDLLCTAKGLTAGLLPLSAVLASDDVYETFLGTVADRRTFFHGHTFTGSALGCAAALAALEQLTAPGFLENIRDDTIPALWENLEPLRAHPHVGDLRGRGLMAAFELVKDKARGEDYPFEARQGHRVVLAARKRGVNTRAIGDLVLAVPPLTITREELALLGKVLRESVDEATLGLGAGV